MEIAPNDITALLQALYLFVGLCCVITAMSLFDHSSPEHCAAAPDLTGTRLCGAAAAHRSCA